MTGPVEELLKRAQVRAASQDVSRVTKRLDLLTATVTVVGAQWLIDGGHPFFGWGLLANNLATGLYIIIKESRP